jgi:riboflavin synthase
MFTGLIREMATVKSLANNTLMLQAAYKPKMGDSIAINGVCLSVTALSSNGFSVELSPETQSHVVVDALKGKVHIEPAMMMGDRFEGHIVQGHVDTIGTITQVKNNGNSFDVFVEVDPSQVTYIVPKGSITIDGVSLTVNEVFESSFRLTIIPITMKETLFGSYKTGSKVNIETDMFARYIEHILKHKQAALDWKTVDQITALY